MEIDYIEIRDPEYNIEAKPYEFVDMYNGYFMTWVDDELMTVPSGLNLVKMKKGDEIMLNTGTDGKAKNTSIMWISKDKYTQNTQYIPKSYQYDWDKKEGKYPRPQMEQIGVYWDENSTLTMIVPDSMYILSGTQTFDIKKGEYYHLFTSTRAISELASYISEEAILLPSFCTYEVSSDKSKIEVELSTEYSYVKVSKHEVSKGKKITITYPSDDTYIFENSGDAQVNRSELAPDVYYDIESDSCTFYVPEGWKVQVDSI